MTAEAQRATLREREPARRAPRVIGTATNMEKAAIAARARADNRERSSIFPVADLPLKLEIFNDLRKLPLSYIVHAATDEHNAPLIRRGEVVVADIGGAAVTGGWYPTDGGLFLIEYRSPPTACERYERRTRSIVQTFLDQRGRWCAGSLRRGVHGHEIICCDGPYPDEIALADKLIAKVLGLYRGGPSIGGAA